MRSRADGIKVLSPVLVWDSFIHSFICSFVELLLSTAFKAYPSPEL